MHVLLSDSTLSSECVAPVLIPVFCLLGSSEVKMMDGATYLREGCF